MATSKYCVSLCKRPTWVPLVPLLRPLDDLQLSESNYPINTHDISLAANTPGTRVPGCFYRALRIILASSTEMHAAGGMSNVLERCKRVEEYTGGKDLVIIYLFDRGNRLGCGQYPMTKLQSEMMNQDHFVPIFPVEDHDEIPALIRQFKTALDADPILIPNAQPFDLVPRLNLHVNADPGPLLNCFRDIVVFFSDLKATAKAIETKKGRDILDALICNGKAHISVAGQPIVSFLDEYFGQEFVAE